MAVIAPARKTQSKSMSSCVNLPYRLLFRVILSPFLFLLLQAAGSPASLIGMTFDLRASQEIWVNELWVEDEQVFRRGSMRVSPTSSVYEGLVYPLDHSGKTPRSRVAWSYRAIDAVDEAAMQTIPDQMLPRREAQAEVVLEDVIDAKALTLLRNDTSRRWVKLVLDFDRDRLEVHGRVE